MAEKRRGSEKPETKLTEQQEQLYAELRRKAEERLKEKERFRKTLKRTARNVLIILLLFCAGAVFWYLRRPQYYPAEGELAVHIIDVGQGDCILVSAGRENMLIDCGEYSQAPAVRNYLERCGVSRLNCIVCTHPHSDHMGGMGYIIDHFKVGQVLVPHVDDSDIPSAVFYEKFLDAVSSKNVGISEVRAGDTFTVGDGRCTVIAPYADKYDNVNNYSVCIMLTHGRKSFLFTGDAEELSEQEMLLSGRLMHTDVYKAGHHGSSTSSSPAFLAAVSPEYAAISCGTANPYGHPDDDVVKRLNKYTGDIYRTDLNGTIVFISDGEEIKVYPERSGK